jgi:BED zinc finger
MTGERWKKYFDLSTIDKNRINGYCKKCNQNYKDKIGISSNFLKHLKQKHVFEYQQMFPNEDESLLKDTIIENDGRATTTDISTTKSTQNRINVAIAKYLIIKCNLPLNLVENSAFRDFMKEYNFKWDPISARNLKHDAIPTFTAKVNKTIYETLNTIDHVTLSVDGWSDRRYRSFLGVTYYFINSKLGPPTF